MAGGAGINGGQAAGRRGRRCGIGPARAHRAAEVHQREVVRIVSGASQAASLELATGTNVIALGGWNGGDPYPTLAQFQEMVASGEIGYFISGGGMGGRAGRQLRGCHLGSGQLPGPDRGQLHRLQAERVGRHDERQSFWRRPRLEGAGARRTALSPGQQVNDRVGRPCRTPPSVTDTAE